MSTFLTVELALLTPETVLSSEADESVESWESWRFRLAEDVSGLVGGGGGVGLDGGGSGLGGGADAADPDGLGGSSSFFAAVADLAAS